MKLKKIAATAAMTGALGIGAMALGTSTAQADPWDPRIPLPPPGHIGQFFDVPPGQIGQVIGVPPGHWDKPAKWFR